MHELNLRDIKIEAGKVVNELIGQIKTMSDYTKYGKGEKCKNHIQLLKNELSKLDRLEFSIAVVGTMKAGKSTAINAIVGQDVLPHRVKAMTTIPTVVSHRKGYKSPKLHVPKHDVLNKVVTLVKKKKLANGLEDSEVEKNIYEKVNSGSVSFQSIYEHKEQIFEALENVNDLIRLAYKMKLDKELNHFNSIDDFPRLEVEFFYLNECEDLQDATFSLIDTPGPNEAGLGKNLARISQQQTQQASSVFLVVDYTQIDGESSGELKANVEQSIKYIGNDKTFVLLNKFDENRKQGKSTSYEDMQKEFSQKFLKGNFSEQAVFPISARDAFYSNLGKNQLKQEQSILDLSCVKVFSEIIMGDFDEDDLEDTKRVHRKCVKKYENSYFDRPMNNVVLKSYDKSKVGSIESALITADAVIKEVMNVLKAAGNSFEKTIRDLKNCIEKIKADIDKIKTIQVSVKRQVDKSVKQSQSSIESLVQEGVACFTNSIEKSFFSELDKVGKRQISLINNEKEQLRDEIAQKEAKKFHLSGTRMNKKIDSKVQDEVNKKIKLIGEKLNQLHANGKISLTTRDNPESHKQQLRDFIKVVSSIINNSLKNVHDLSLEQVHEILIDLIQKTNDLVKTELGDVVKEVEKKIGGGISIALPTIDLPSYGCHHELNSDQLIKSDSKDREEKVKSKSFGSGVKRFFGGILGADWGYDNVSYTEHTTSLSKKDILEHADGASKLLLKDIKKKTKYLFEHEVDQPISEKVELLITVIEELRQEMSLVLAKRDSDEQKATADKVKIDSALEVVKKTAARKKKCVELLKQF